MSRTGFPEEATFDGGEVASHIDVHGKDTFGKGDSITKALKWLMVSRIRPTF